MVVEAEPATGDDTVDPRTLLHIHEQLGEAIIASNDNPPRSLNNTKGDAYLVTMGKLYNNCCNSGINPDLWEKALDYKHVRQILISVGQAGRDTHVYACVAILLDIVKEMIRAASAGTADADKKKNKKIKATTATATTTTSKLTFAHVPNLYKVVGALTQKTLGSGIMEVIMNKPNNSLHTFLEVL